MLVRRTLGGSVRVLCANCATVRGRRPLTLEQLVAEVFPPGDRRRADRRRGDRRTYVERRVPRGEVLVDCRREGDDRRAA